MTVVARWARALCEFVIGDDPIAAAGVVVAIGVTAVIAAAGAPAWWVMPVAVIAVLGLSLRRAG